MASIAGKDVGGFCEKCQVFNLRIEAFHESPFEEKRMHQLGKFDEVEARANCPLCQFLANAFRNGPVRQDLLRSSRIQGSWSSIANGSPDACLTFWLVQYSEADKVELSVRRFGNTETPSLGDARAIEDSFINPDVPKKWLDRCKQNHTCKSVPLDETRAGRLPDGFIVIDVVGNCLVTASSSCQFVALSYVWGNTVAFKTTSQNIEELFKMNSLKSVWDRLSPTIRDAIQFTQQLGERYIWIDSLCIQQDNAKNSAANIEAMDSIYRHATVVIVAANDDAATQGLPGVSRPRAIQQFRVELFPGLQVLGRFNHCSYMDQTVYRSRGWTFQEEQLGTRAIIFVNRQLYFVCPSHVYAEDIHEGGEDGRDEPLKSPDIVNRYINESRAQSSIYFQAVQTYTQRNLTYPTDILNAFSGIAAVMSQSLSTRFVNGLPTCIFDLALLWQPASKLSRRKGYPSWAWAGWDGAVHWNGDTMELVSYGSLPDIEQEAQLITSWLRNHTWIQWTCRGPEGTLEPVWDPKKDQTVGNIFWPSSGSQQAPHIGYDGEAVTASNPYGRYPNCDTIIADYRGRTTEPQITPSLLSEIDSDLQPLFFETITLRLYIRPSSTYLRYGSIDPPWQPNGRVIFLLYTLKHQLCGYVMLDETWQDKFSAETPYDFLLLSEANYYCDWGRPHENHPFKKFYGFREYEEFHAMMIEWKSVGQAGIKAAERVGLGRVLKEVLKSADDDAASWKQVILI